MNFSRTKRLKGDNEMFKGLGKPTLRGVRKCPNCSTLNGIRSLCCKNKSCNMVFRENSKKSETVVDAMEIITGSTTQVFSVSLGDRDLNNRSFVECPMISELEVRGQNLQVQSVLPLVAKCHVDSCQKQVQLPIREGTDVCPHIQSIRKCTSKAIPLTLKNSVLSSLPISSDIRLAIWSLATETTGPLVQRISRNVMVVKCKVQQKHKLGFLHLTFSDPVRRKKDSQAANSFHCSCRTFESPGNKVASVGEDPLKRCVHFYACVCAFASDKSLSKEFHFFMQMESLPTDIPSAIATDSSMSGLQITIIDGQLTASQVTNGAKPVMQSRKRVKDDTLAQASSALLTLQESRASPSKKAAPLKKVLPGNLVVSPTVSPTKHVTTVMDGVVPAITFTDWLGSVTEKINQTMHFQFDGTPETLVFHVPQIFFDCLQQRISCGVKKKRLPNSTIAFVRKDALPLGTFTKYTWHLTNIQQIQRIFDTPNIHLEVKRTFVELKDGSFQYQDTKTSEVDAFVESYRKLGGQKLIKPFELKTFLKVGTVPGEVRGEPSPFIIEWIPDILPKSHIGELRIRFEYGHEKNGKCLNRSAVSHEAACAAHSVT